MIVIDTDRLQSDEQYRQEFRHRCETDHFFLADVVGWTGFIPSIHQPVKELYFPKNRLLPIEEQHPVKFRMHLDPRLTGKTTFGSVDTLQYILAFPESMTIVNASSTQPLAEALCVQQVKFFWNPPWAAPTALQLAYPELTFASRKEPEGIWRSPLLTQLEKDPTLQYTSPQTQQSGWHPWVLNPDDMAETVNSGIDATDASRQKVISRYYTNKNTLRRGGYLNIRGTRYHPKELYGYALDNMDPSEWKVLIRAALLVKSGERLMPGVFPDEDEVVLLFPEILPYKVLRSMFMEHYESFMTQQMNDPQGGSVPQFEQNLYQSVLCDREHIPLLGETFLCWRLTYGGKDYMSKYVEGAAARVYGGKLYVVDAWRGIFTPTGLARKIVKECRRHQTGKIMMEALPGSSHAEEEIKNESYRQNFPIRVQWLDYEEDDNVRHTRMLQLEPRMRSGRVLISTSIKAAAESRSQFLHFGLVPENGIVDCISRLSAKIPATILREEIEEEEIELHRRRREQMSAHMAWGQAAEDIQAGLIEAQRREQLKAEASNYAWERANSFGLPPLPGGLDG